MAEFQEKCPSAKKWREESNSIICLTVKDEKELFQLNKRILEDCWDTYTFHEPDFCYELTAIAIRPDPENYEYTANLPLAGKNPSPPEAIQRERSLRKLFEAMESCEQTPGQSVIDHGLAVKDQFWYIWNGHILGHDTWKWAKPLPKVPSWVGKNWDLFKTEVEPYLFEFEKYLIVHDCGKPFCEESDERKFLNHAEKSVETWAEHSDDKLVLDFIRNDMWVHTMKANEVPAFKESGLSLFLLLAGLAEINTNAAMFGGQDSESFKIKYKQLDRRGKAVLDLFK